MYDLLNDTLCVLRPKIKERKNLITDNVTGAQERANLLITSFCGLAFTCFLLLGTKHGLDGLNGIENEAAIALSKLKVVPDGVLATLKLGVISALFNLIIHIITAAVMFMLMTSGVECSVKNFIQSDTKYLYLSSRLNRSSITLAILAYDILDSFVRMLPTLVPALCSLAIICNASVWFYLFLIPVYLLIVVSSVTIGSTFYLLWSLFLRKVSIAWLGFLGIFLFIELYKKCSAVISLIINDNISVLLNGGLNGTWLSKLSFGYSDILIYAKNGFALLALRQLLISTIITISFVTLTIWLIGKLLDKIITELVPQNTSTFSLWNVFKKFGLAKLWSPGVERTICSVSLNGLLRKYESLIQFAIPLGLSACFIILMNSDSFGLDKLLQIRYFRNHQIETRMLSTSLCVLLVLLPLICNAFIHHCVSEFGQRYDILRQAGYEPADIIKSQAKTIFYLTSPLIILVLVKLEVIYSVRFEALASFLLIILPIYYLIVLTAVGLGSIYIGLAEAQIKGWSLALNMTVFPTILVFSLLTVYSWSLIRQVRWVFLIINDPNDIYLWYIELICILTVFIWIAHYASEVILNLGVSLTEKRLAKL